MSEISDVIQALRSYAESPEPVRLSHWKGYWLSGGFRGNFFLCNLCKCLGIGHLWDEFYTEQFSQVDVPEWWGHSLFPTQTAALQATAARAEWLRNFANWLEARDAAL